MKDKIVTVPELDFLKCEQCGKLLDFNYEGIRSDRKIAYCCGLEYFTEICSYFVNLRKSTFDK